MTTENLSENQKSLAKDELMKIFELSVSGIRADVFSGSIDAVWHEMLENSDTYESFCLEKFGCIIPHTKEYGEGKVEFVESYEARWGTLPDAWFTDENGVMNKELYGTYLDTNSILASWNCNPALTEPSKKKDQKEKGSEKSQQKSNRLSKERIRFL